jgi:protein involved in polysaccharide export with SLBB domain
MHWGRSKSRFRGHLIAIARVPKVLLFASLLLLVFSLVPGAGAQQTNETNIPKNPSDLALENQTHVAASTAEIRAVLANQPGLMVELKRWVAMDATNHGQIVSDADLTSDAIYARLDSDVRFRSVATALLQKYGYLQPQFNPKSEQAQEQELLIQQRAIWLAHQQQEILARASQPYAQNNTQGLSSCNAQDERTCPPVQNQVLPTGVPGQNEMPISPLPNPNAPPPEQPNLPSNPNRGPVQEELAQLMQGGSATAGLTGALPTSASYPGISGAGGTDFNSNDPTDLSALGNLGPEPSNPQLQALSGGAASYQPGTEVYPNNLMQPGSVGASNPRANIATYPYAPGVLGGTFNGRFPEMAQPPQIVRKPSPYNDIPSLYDMYMQAVPNPAKPVRFGEEVFENGIRDPRLIPMDLPVGPNYVVGPGDGLTFDLWGSVSERLYRTVDPEGRVSLPEVGPVLVSGKSLADVQQSVQQILRTQFRDVSADVSLSRLRTIRVYVVGDVARPGAYDISSLSTPLNALFVAGGPTDNGSLRLLKHYRGNQLVQDVDMYDLLLHGVRGDIQRLENGDTILVPPIGPEVTVEGMVRRPAIYELKDDKSLASVLALAGGVLPSAALSHIEVQRLVAHKERTMLSVNIPPSANSAELTKQLDAFRVQDGDRIRIFPIAPYNQDVIYLEGHVIRPGRYSYHQGMRVTDLISSYKDLLPEPSTKYAEIIRLDPPDDHPTVESFNLAQAFAHPSQSPVLQPLDTVRIFSRFDFQNPPTVSVLGDVRMPGTYQTSGQVHLRDAIHLAGGLSPDAQTKDAQVFRYMPDGQLKIFSVNLSAALAGNPLGNIVLNPRDRVLVHESPNAVEPAAVYLEGDAARPGKYPLTTNMRVADLIRVGGGLKPSADTQTADLTHYQWADQTKLTGLHEAIALSAALTGNQTSDIPLHNGDVLTIRQLPGWEDLGATVVVKGEVNHPGTYGIRPGERLSSVLERAGGFRSTAYPQGIVLLRDDVRELEQKSRDQLIQHIKLEGDTVKTSMQATGQEQVALVQAEQTQRQQMIEALEQTPVVGRLVVQMPNNLNRFRGSPDDIQLRRGDTIFIPKEPQFVTVTGQVYNTNAITYQPGRNANWYLRQAGGPTDQANKKAIFIVRANGSIVSNQGNHLWTGGVLSTAIDPGDTIVVPEKAISGASTGWKNLISIAQLAQAAAMTAYIAMH